METTMRGFWVYLLLSSLVTSYSLGDESTADKVERKTHDATRAAKRAGRDAKTKVVCKEDDAQCKAAEAAHGTKEEVKDYVKDKAKEAK